MIVSYYVLVGGAINETFLHVPALIPCGFAGPHTASSRSFDSHGSHMSPNWSNLAENKKTNAAKQRNQPT